MTCTAAVGGGAGLPPDPKSIAVAQHEWTEYPIMSSTSITPLGSHFSDEDRLKLLQWHIDRYDRLRSSTSARAAVLLSADAALLAGSIVLSSSYLGTPGNASWAIWAMKMGAIGALILGLVSISYCTNAIAAWRTTRRLHAKEIPSRFAFNWGDTVSAVDGFSNFAATLSTLDSRQIAENGAAELWTAILQHKRRHKHLRYGIHAFRAATLFFVGVAVILIFFGS